MALTYTPPGEIGIPLPSFQLPKVTGGELSDKDLKGKITVLAFICNHCPYVKAIEDRWIALARAYQGKANFVAVSANDPADYPEDAPHQLKARAKAKNYPFPYLFDESQNFARALGAVCTPDFYIFTDEQRLAYRGRLDDSPRDARLVQRQELKEALDKLLKNETPSPDQRPSLGCSIKWKLS